MAFPTYQQYPGYQPVYYPQPVPDQLAQLRQQQMQPMVQQPQQMQPQTPAQEPTGIIWVQGEAGAKAYLVAPGNTVQLWDSENPVIYLKSADMSGMPSMRILDYTERGGSPAQKLTAAPQIDLSRYITRDELEDILAKRLQRPGKPAKTKEEADNG